MKQKAIRLLQIKSQCIHNLSELIKTINAYGSSAVYNCSNGVAIIGDGDDTIKVADKGETDTEKLFYYHIIDAGDENKYIYNIKVELSTINSSSGNDTIISEGGAYKSARRTSINGGNGDNKITVNSAMTNGIIVTGAEYNQGG